MYAFSTKLGISSYLYVFPTKKIAVKFYDIISSYEKPGRFFVADKLYVRSRDRVTYHNHKGMRSKIYFFFDRDETYLIFSSKEEAENEHEELSKLHKQPLPPIEPATYISITNPLSVYE